MARPCDLDGVVGCSVPEHWHCPVRFYNESGWQFHSFHSDQCRRCLLTEAEAVRGGQRLDEPAPGRWVARIITEPTHRLGQHNQHTYGRFKGFTLLDSDFRWLRYLWPDEMSRIKLGPVRAGDSGADKLWDFDGLWRVL